MKCLKAGHTTSLGCWSVIFHSQPDTLSNLLCLLYPRAAPVSCRLSQGLAGGPSSHTSQGPAWSSSGPLQPWLHAVATQAGAPASSFCEPGVLYLTCTIWHSVFQPGNIGSKPQSISNSWGWVSVNTGYLHDAIAVTFHILAHLPLNPTSKQ